MKFNNYSALLLGALGVAISTPAQAYTNATGNVTPSGMIITVTGASLIRSDNSELEILSGSFPVEFLRSGTPFAAIPISTISVPYGRYIGIKLKFDDKYQVKLNGDKYIGTDQGSIISGTALYTVAAVADSSKANSATTTPGTAQYVTLPTVSNCTDCSSTTYLARPACVAASADKCNSTDEWVGGDGTKLPNLNMLVDLYQSVHIDAQDLSISRGAVYPFLVVGNPGAAIHLVAGSRADKGSKNVSVLFGSDKKVHSVATWGAGGVTSLVGPRGGSWVTATAGKNVNQYGPTMFSELTTTGTGVLKYPMGDCPESKCTSSGLAILTGLLNTKGSTVTFSCEADTTGALGYTYTGGDCSNVTQGSMKISRIIDPGNLFGICTEAGGVCSDTTIDGASSDGYL